MDADTLSDEKMQQIAAWTNLPETTFVLKASAGAHYRLRIFTPTRELPFAGHPTIGSAIALLRADIVASAGILLQECGSGTVEIEVPDNWREAGLMVRIPDPGIQPAAQPSALCVALGADMHPLGTPLRIDVGAVWVTVELPTVKDVRSLQPDLSAIAKYSRAVAATGVTVFSLRDAGDADVVVRTFAPAAGIPEDPACGSGNGAVAAYRNFHGWLGGEYIASQGRELGRNGIVHVRLRNRIIHVGGNAIVCIEGQLHV
jgi:PhzF family phenazine biosynthesis protein